MFCRLLLVKILAIAFLCLLQTSSQAAAPSVADALKLKPVQEGVDYDTPASSQVQECTIKAEKINGKVAWVVRGPGGKVLRQFSDSDGDNRVDRWCYFRDGLEVYRDLDANYNDKADQYRWFHHAGMRWGVDRDEDGTIDNWKMISAEEVAEEVIKALSTNDAKRFQRLLLSSQELKQLGLNKMLEGKLAKSLKSAPATFRKLAASKKLGKNPEFHDFGGLKPGMVPAETGSAEKDLVVYENVSAMVRTGDDFEQLRLGTLVNVEGAWRLLESPALSEETTVASGMFYDSSPGASGLVGNAGLAMSNAPTEKMQEILSKLEELDQQLMQASAKQKPALNKSRANLLLQLASTATKASERSQWLRQLADMVSAATQDGSFPGGLNYLKAVEQKLAKQKSSKDLLAYFQFQRMLGEYYGVTLMDPKVDHAKAHGEWLEDLEAFVVAHPKTDNSAEALRQLAMGTEISGDNKAALKWYRQIIENHPSSIHAPMAQGAVTRLSSVGRGLKIAGKAVNGRNVDTSRLRGKAVVVQYWTSSSEVCKSDHAVLSNLYKKYGGNRGLEIVGVNLDYSREEMLSYLKESRLQWPQLYESGGFESRYAQEMGVVTVPLMLFIGPDGKVINDNIQAAEIEEAFKKLQTRQARKPKSR